MMEDQRLTASAVFHGFIVPGNCVQIITESKTKHKKSVNISIKRGESLFLGAAFTEVDTGLDSIMELPPSSRRQANAHRALAFDGFESFDRQKEKRHPFGCSLHRGTI